MRVKITYWFLAFFVLFNSTSYSQQQFKNDAERLKYANELFNNANYVEAKPHMSHLLGTDPKSAEFNFKYGACLLFAEEEKEESIRHLRYAAKQGGVDSRVIFFLGKAYHLTYRFNDALIEYERFKKFGEEKDQISLEVDLHIKMAKNGKKLLKNLTELVVDDKQESSYSRFQYSYDLSEIGGKILVTDEFQTKIDKKLEYRSLVYFPSGKQDVLFFSSYGKEGTTGLDLYKIRRLIDGGWADPEILPSHINTPYDDSYGFLHADGTTFYFCSKGHSSMGGYDVFKSVYSLLDNTFSTPVNLDYKINTPDDDIMYIVDSLNNNAYFASARAAKGGYLDVYKVRVKTFPMLNVILAGAFINEINPSDYYASIKVENISTGEIEGEFHPNKEGKYIIVLPRAGKYKLIVETPKSEKIHSGIVDIPAQEELKPLKQEILLVNKTGQEQLIIRNLFDEEVENADAILAQVMMGLADPEINASNYPDSLFALDGNDVLNDVINVSTDIDELKGLIAEAVEQDTKDVSDIEEKMNNAFLIAKKNSEAATEATKQAENLLAQIESISDAEEKQQKINEAKKLHQQSKELNNKANIALNLSNNLKKELDEKNTELEETKAIAIAVESALAQESHEKAVEELGKIQEELNDIVTRNTDDLHKRNAYEELLEASVIIQDKADEAMANAVETRKEIEVLQNRVKNLVDQQAKAKKQDDKDSYQIEIDAINEDIELSKQMVAESFTKNEELQVKASDLKYQARLMDDLYNNELDSDLTFTEEEKAAIENSINSSDNEITSNESSLSQYTGVSESSTTDTEAIDETTAYVNYEDEISETSDIEDPIEKAKKENEINKDWVTILDEDIEKTKKMISDETNETKKEELENTVAALVKLKEEKENLISQNDAIIEGDIADNSSETNNNKSAVLTNTSDNFNEYEDQLAETSSISDPVERAQKQNEINNELLSIIGENIQDAKDQLALEEDSEKRVELESKIDELTQYKNKTTDNIAENNQIIDEASVVDTETTEITENPNAEKYENYQDQIDAMATITDPVEKAEKENEINHQWLADLKEEGKQAKEQMDAEEDPAKETELLLKINSLFKEMSAIEGNIEDNELKIADAESLASETTDVVDTETETNETTDIIDTETETNVSTDVVDTETETNVSTDVVDTEVETNETTDIVDTETETNETIDVIQSEEVAGISFDPNETEIETYEVSVVEEKRSIDQLAYSSSTSQQLISENKKEINEIGAINTNIRTLESELANSSEKDAAKIQKNIDKLNKAKAKKELKLADVIKSANEKETEIALSGMNETKQTSEDLPNVTFSQRQAKEFENAGEKLLADATVLRIEAEGEKDKVIKNKKLNEAVGKETAAASNFKKAKKMYAEAVVEAYNIEQENITSVPTDDAERLSNQLVVKADNADAKAVEYANQASKLREDALNLEKEEKTNTNLEADKYEQLSLIKEDEAKNLRTQGTKIKIQEDAIIEEQDLLTNLNSEEVEPIRKSTEYKEFYEKQQEIEIFEKQLEQEKANAKSYESLALQQENKAKDFEAKAVASNNETEKVEYIEKAEELKKNAQENKSKKQAAEATIEDIHNSIDFVTEERDNTIASLDESTANDYKALALSDYDKDPIKAPVIQDVLASNFVPPSELTNNIFAVNTAMSYSAENPIPVNPINPNGLTYKVQIGAFRNPIPQDLFKGFAPISAEVIRDGITRYRVGYFTAWEVANNAKNEIRNMGYSDAFVVAIYNGNSMSISEARKLEQEGTPASTDIATINYPSNTTTETETNDADYVSNLGDGAANAEAVELIKGLFFTVQIGAFSKPIQADNVFNISPLVTKYVNNLYKYSTGIYRSVAAAAVRKNEVVAKGLEGAFITAYYNGEKISVSKANELINELGDEVYAISEGGTVKKNNNSNTESSTNEVTEDNPPQNTNAVTVQTTNTGTEYYVDLGNYEGNVPEKIVTAMLLISDYKIEAIRMNRGSQYTCGVFLNKADAEIAKEKFISVGVDNAIVTEYQDGEKVTADISLPPTALNGLVYKVFLGTYVEGVPQARSSIFLQLDYLGIESINEEEGITYYCGNESLYGDAKKLLKKFSDQGVSIARIIAFLHGKEIDVYEARKLTNE